MGRFSDIFENLMRINGLLLLFALGVWALNGGKNDFGLIHNFTVCIVLTVTVVLLLMFVSFLVIGFIELMKWLILK